MSEEETFASIDAIDWPSQSHAYGSAQDVGQNLKRLRSTDPVEQGNAYGALGASIYHQGSRYEATATAVPILCSLVRLEDTPDRPNIMRMITQLAVGEPLHRWMRRIDIEGWRKDVASLHRPTFADELAKERAEWLAEADTPDEVRKRERQLIFMSTADEMRSSQTNELAAYDAVKAQISTILPILKDPLPVMRIEAAYCLSWFPEEEVAVSEALLPLFEHETDQLVLATYLIALGQVCSRQKANAAVAARLQTAFTSSKHIVKWSSAIATILLSAETEDHVNEALLALTDRQYVNAGLETATEYFIPYADPSLAAVAGMVLSQASEEYKPRMVGATIKAIGWSKGEETVVLTEMALRELWPAPFEEDKASELSRLQLDFLEVLSKVDRWLWSYANFQSLLYQRGLPGNPARLEKLLAQAQEPDVVGEVDSKGVV